MVTQWIVLGHVISHNGIEVDKAKTDLIVNLPPPTSVKVIMSCLGHADFYRRFIKDFSKIAKPLTNLLAKDVPFNFSNACHVAFIKLKEALTSAPVLQLPIWGDAFELMCGASDYAVGVVLGQCVETPCHILCESHSE